MLASKVPPPEILVNISSLHVTVGARSTETDSESMRIRQDGGFDLERMQIGEDVTDSEPIDNDDGEVETLPQATTFQQDLDPRLFDELECWDEFDLSGDASVDNVQTVVGREGGMVVVRRTQ